MREVVISSAGGLTGRMLGGRLPLVAVEGAVADRRQTSDHVNYLARGCRSGILEVLLTRSTVSRRAGRRDRGQA